MAGVKNALTSRLLATCRQASTQPGKSAALCAFVLALSSAICAAAPDKAKTTPLSERVIYLHYNHTGAPSAISRDQAIAAGEHAAKVWLACDDIRFVMSSDSLAKPGVRDGQYIIGWAAKIPAGAGTTAGALSAVLPYIRDGKIIEFDIVLNAKTVHTADDAVGTLVYSLGRALGLPDSAQPGSVMQQKATYTESSPRPNRADIKACLELYP
ncbi:MAG: hypothetical protein ABI612_16550 [Betaproteobacteria bacterium]